MHEEGKAYLGWERIKDYIRTEEHKRVTDDTSRADTPLSKLKNDEFLALRTQYPKNTPVVRLLFCLMAVLMMLWDFMLLITVLYYHMMIEKGRATSLHNRYAPLELVSSIFKFGPNILFDLALLAFIPLSQK